MLKKAFIGVDPGQKGAICLLVPEDKKVHFATTTKPADLLLEQLREWDRYFTIPPVMMEDVSSIPGASAGSNFKFGYNVGLLQGIIMASAVGLDLVRPKEWQKVVGLPTKKRTSAELKRAVADLAYRLYPKAELYGPKGGLLDGRSDALMIAHYAMIKYAAIQK